MSCAGRRADPLLVVLVGEERAVRAAAVGGPALDDAVAAAAEDARPARQQPGQVGPDEVVGVGRVGELDPFAGKVERTSRLRGLGVVHGHLDLDGDLVAAKRAAAYSSEQRTPAGVRRSTRLRRDSDRRADRRRLTLALTAMRLGVLDVGSNTVHLLVVDAHRGAHPWPAYSEKSVLRLAERIGPRRPAVDRRRPTTWSRRSPRPARRPPSTTPTSCSPSPPRRCGTRPTRPRCWPGCATRPASTCRCSPARTRPGMTFLAVRRWFGWSAGRLLVLDIGGGSLEIAAGIDEEPEVALSLPLGAGRLTRERLSADPPSAGRGRAAARVRATGSSADVDRPAAGTGRGAPRRRSGRWPGWPAPRRRRPASGRRAR